MWTTSQAAKLDLSLRLPKKPLAALKGEKAIGRMSMSFVKHGVESEASLETITWPGQPNRLV
jgi:hypothetical protein